MRRLIWGSLSDAASRVISLGSGGEDEIPKELGLHLDCESEKGGDNS